MPVFEIFKSLVEGIASQTRFASLPEIGNEMTGFPPRGSRSMKSCHCHRAYYRGHLCEYVNIYKLSASQAFLTG